MEGGSQEPGARRGGFHQHNLFLGAATTNTTSRWVKAFGLPKSGRLEARCLPPGWAGLRSLPRPGKGSLLPLPAPGRSSLSLPASAWAFPWPLPWCMCFPSSNPRAGLERAAHLQPELARTNSGGGGGDPVRTGEPTRAGRTRRPVGKPGGRMLVTFLEATGLVGTPARGLHSETVFSDLALTHSESQQERGAGGLGQPPASPCPGSGVPPLASRVGRVRPGVGHRV